VWRNQGARGNRLFHYRPIQERKHDSRAGGSDAGKTGAHHADPGPDGGCVVIYSPKTFLKKRTPDRAPRVGKIALVSARSFSGVRHQLQRGR
jgi:hypothetical protein